MMSRLASGRREFERVAWSGAVGCVSVLVRWPRFAKEFIFRRRILVTRQHIL